MSESIEKGLWKDPKIPKSGWKCVGVEDLGEPSLICEMCQSANVRFVQLLQHDEISGLVKAGCVCAGHLTGDMKAAKVRERSAKSSAAKRKRSLTAWIDETKWRRLDTGNFTRKVSKTQRVTLFFRDGGWKWVVDGKFSSQKFERAQDAARDVHPHVYKEAK